MEYSQQEPSKIPPEEVAVQIGRLAKSAGLNKADSLQRLLRYTVEQTLQGRGAELKESAIAMDVFGRGAAFDPRIDPIVRVQAKKLRDRIEAYYAGPGIQDSVRIEYKKGSYSPEIRFAGGASPERLRRRRTGQLLVAGFALCLAAGLFWYATRRPKTPVEASLNRSVVVLPFVSLSESEADKYLSDGLTDELITLLTSVQDLKVVGRTSAFHYQGAKKDVHQIGRELNVQTVLEGSVRKDGNQIRVQARLIDVATGYNTWSASYDRTFQSILDVQEDLSRTIVAAVREKLGGTNRPRPQPSTSSEDAYYAFLRGKYFLIHPSADNFPKGIAALEASVKADPKFAAAYASLSETYALSANFAPGLFPDAYHRAEVAAGRALSLDPNCAEAHAALGYIRFTEANWKKTEYHLREAVRLNPGLTYGHQWLGSAFLLPHGRLTEALAELKLALATDPASPTIQQDMARIQWFMGDLDSAEKSFRAAIELEPRFARPYRDLGVLLGQQGRFSDAIAMSLRSVELSRRHPLHLADLGWVYGVAGRRVEAMAVIRELTERIDKKTISPGNLVKPWIGLGDSVKAADAYLQTAANDIFPNHYVYLDKRYERFRQDPRIMAHTRAIGMPCPPCPRTEEAEAVPKGPLRSRRE
ncbi:MAG: tetratricopeptide repeat protein [Bryobacteraceae bacterium]